MTALAIKQPSLLVPDWATWSRVFNERFVVSDTGCWLFTGCLVSGYGSLSLHGQMWKAHRLSWVLINGALPALAPDTFHGTCVCHRCDVRNCIRPLHLFAGSHADNIHDMERKGRGRHPAGDEHFARIDPSRIAHGDRNGSRTRPDVRPRGSRHAEAKLTEEQVVQIRELYATAKYRQVDLAGQFGVSQVLISVITRRKGWRHL